MLRMVKCGTDELSAVREFWAQAYGPQHILGNDAGLFAWQFGPDAGGFGNPQAPPDRFHMQLAMDGNKVVGCLGYIPTEVTVRGRVLRGCWLANWKILPETARLGLGPLLLREVLREVEIVVNVGISAEARGLLSRMGWLDLTTLTRWVRALQPETADALLPADAVGEWPVLPAQDGQSLAYTVNEVSAFGEEAERLWDSEWGAAGAGTRRSVQLLNWRYDAHPTFHYQLLDVRAGDTLVGFAVYRRETLHERQIHIGRIVELVVKPEAASALLDAICDHASHQHVAVLDFFCSSRRLDAALQSRGFQRTDAGRASYMPSLFQPLNRTRSDIACMIYAPTFDVPMSADEWYVTKGDADQDRPN